MKRRFSDLPLLCDPSHICGHREMIQSVAQTALDLNYDGLMIESHIHPEHALSDRQQQLTPDAFKHLLASLIIRQPSTNDSMFKNLLEELRDKIDHMDADILDLISERMGIAREIGRYKKENNMTILQVQRWNEIVRTRLEFWLNRELTSDFVIRLYELIHDESIHQQTRVMQNVEQEKENIKN